MGVDRKRMTSFTQRKGSLDRMLMALPCKLSPNELHNRSLLNTHFEQTNFKSITIRAQKMVIKPLDDVSISLIQVDSSHYPIWYLCQKCGRAITDILLAKNHQLVCEIDIVFQKECIEGKDFQNNQVSVHDVEQDNSYISEISEDNFTNIDKADECSETCRDFNSSPSDENEDNWNNSTKIKLFRSNRQSVVKPRANSVRRTFIKSKTQNIMSCRLCSKKFSSQRVLTLHEKKHGQSVSVNIQKMGTKSLVGDDVGISLIQFDSGTGPVVWYSCAKCRHTNLGIKDARIHQLICVKDVSVKEESIKNNEVLNPVLIQIKMDGGDDYWNESLQMDPLQTDPLKIDALNMDSLKIHHSGSESFSTNSIETTNTVVRAPEKHIGKLFKDIIKPQYDTQVVPEHIDSLEFNYLESDPFDTDSNEISKTSPKVSKWKTTATTSVNQPEDVTEIVSEPCPETYEEVTIFSETRNAIDSDVVREQIVKLFSCVLCKKMFLNKEEMAIHWRIHYEEKPYKYNCQTCSKSFQVLEALTIHENTHEEEARTIVNKFVCNVCGNLFESQISLTNHQKSHIPTELFPCIICLQLFINKSSLRKHKKIHREKTFDCDFCEKKFTFKASLQIHRFIHTGELPYNCDRCNYSTTQLKTLIAHRKIHAEEIEKPFKCDKCNYVTNTAQQLGFHKYKHLRRIFKRRAQVCITGPCLCKFCGKLFNYSQICLIHEFSQHTKPKPVRTPYSCIICSKSFIYKSNANFHVKKIHHEILFNPNGSSTGLILKDFILASPSVLLKKPKRFRCKKIINY